MMAEIQAMDFILRKWKANPNLNKKEIIRAYNWEEDQDPENNRPFSNKEIERAKKSLKQLSPAAYKSIFPEEE